MEDLIRMSRKLPDTGIMLDSRGYESRSDTGISVSSNPQWDLQLLQGTAPGLPDINVAIERTQREIARVLSCESMLLDGGGSNALSKDKSVNAYLAVNSCINDIKEQATKDLIPALWKLNGFPKDKMPRFKVEEVSSRDAESVAVILRDMASAGATLSPDDPVINDVRDMLGISQVDLEKATERLLEQQTMDALAFEASLNQNTGKEEI